MEEAYDRMEGIFSRAGGFHSKPEGMYFCAGCF